MLWCFAVNIFLYSELVSLIFLSVKTFPFLSLSSWQDRSGLIVKWFSLFSCRLLFCSYFESSENGNRSCATKTKKKKNVEKVDRKNLVQKCVKVDGKLSLSTWIQLSKRYQSWNKKKLAHGVKRENKSHLTYRLSINAQKMTRLRRLHSTAKAFWLLR